MTQGSSPDRPVNIHGTAIVIATTGLIFVGPSGSGKSGVAHACLSQARALGVFARLVSDDQVFVTASHGRIIASRPQSIAGRMELRGSGIVRMPSIARARLDYAVLPDALENMERLPEEGELFEILPDMLLPVVRVDRNAAVPLTIIARFIPFLGLSL